jgi:hypothetical protein
MEWIKFALVKYYFDEEAKTFVNKNNVTKYFAEQYKTSNEFKEPALNRLKYIKKIVVPERPCIKIVCRQTVYDGKYDIYQNLLKPL